MSLEQASFDAFKVATGARIDQSTAFSRPMLYCFTGDSRTPVDPEQLFGAVTPTEEQIQGSTAFAAFVDGYNGNLQVTMRGHGQPEAATSLGGLLEGALEEEGAPQHMVNELRQLAGELQDRWSGVPDRQTYDRFYTLGEAMRP